MQPRARRSEAVRYSVRVTVATASRDQRDDKNDRRPHSVYVNVALVCTCGTLRMLGLGISLFISVAKNLCENAPMLTLCTPAFLLEVNFAAREILQKRIQLVTFYFRCRCLQCHRCSAIWRTRFKAHIRPCDWNSPIAHGEKWHDLSGLKNWVNQLCLSCLSARSWMIQFLLQLLLKHKKYSIMITHLIT